MPFTSLTTQPIVPAGTVQALVSADITNGNVVDVGRMYLQVNNTGGSPATVTVAVPITFDGMTVGPRAVVVAAAATVKIPLNPADYQIPSGQTDAGRAHVTYSGGATLSVGVFSL